MFLGQAFKVNYRLFVRQVSAVYSSLFGGFSQYLLNSRRQFAIFPLADGCGQVQRVTVTQKRRIPG
jgi:hypothetical protein